MKKLDIITALLLVIGGLNWGLVGIAKWNLVEALVGGASAVLASAVYALVGMAAVYQILTWRFLQNRKSEPVPVIVRSRL